MRNAEERIDRLHTIVKELERQRDGRRLAGLGGLTTAFAILLIAAIAGVDGLWNGVAEGSLTGTSLLSENGGGYVLVAVIAFFVGVVLTAALIRLRRKARK